MSTILRDWFLNNKSIVKQYGPLVRDYDKFMLGVFKKVLVDDIDKCTNKLKQLRLVYPPYSQPLMDLEAKLTKLSKLWEEFNIELDYRMYVKLREESLSLKF